MSSRVKGRVTGECLTALGFNIKTSWQLLSVSVYLIVSKINAKCWPWRSMCLSALRTTSPPPKKTRSQISFWALYKTWIFFLSFFPFIYFFYVKTKLRQRLALSLFHVFLLLLFYRSYSLLVPNPHWNLTLKRQQQYNGRSLLPVWPLQAPAAAAAMLCRGQTACQPRLPLSTSGLWPGPCTAESH